jgi:hypothetical protein
VQAPGYVIALTASYPSFIPGESGLELNLNALWCHPHFGIHLTCGGILISLLSFEVPTKAGHRTDKTKFRSELCNRAEVVNCPWDVREMTLSS